MKGEQSTTTANGYREVRYHFTDALPAILRDLGCSLLISTNASGQLAVVSAVGEGLQFSCHHFGFTRGITLGDEQLAIATDNEIYFLANNPELASQIEPVGQRDACLVTRSCFVTGNLDTHEIAWSGNELWLVNSRFSCLATLHDDYSFLPRWRPPFVTQLAPEDRCHLSGLAMNNGQPKLVTAFAETDSPQGWRDEQNAGCVVDVESNETIARELVMPHSPRVRGDRIYVLDSGRGNFSLVDEKSHSHEVVANFPGFTRGLAFAGPFAFVGLSKLSASDQRCGVGVVDLRSGQAVAAFQFLSGINEVFDVAVVPNAKNLALVGPNPEDDDAKPVWVIPNVDQVANLTAHEFHRGVARPPTSVTNPRQQDASSATSIAFFNQGNQCLRDDRFFEAESFYRLALQAEPRLVEAHSNLGAALHFQQRLDDAAQSLAQAIEINPHSVDARMNLATLLLYRGEFEQGWMEYEARWACDGYGDKPKGIDQIAPRWDGTPLANKSILVYPEQGVGDDIMFASCLPDLIASARRCVVLARPRLASLFRRSFPGAEILLTDSSGHQIDFDQVGQIDFQIAAGSLPLHFRSTQESFSLRQSYLVADEELVATWRERFEQLGDGPKVGISWRGGAEPAEVRRRCIAIEKWAPILAANAQFVNLQYGECTGELNWATENGFQLTHSQDVNPLEDLEAFAAKITALDLVISIDNSTVHLAGALGVPVWMMTPQYSASGWRWQQGQEQSAWYPSVQVVRQTQFGEWSNVIDSVAESLSHAIKSANFAKPMSKPSLGGILPSETKHRAESLVAQALAMHQARRVHEAIVTLREAIALEPDRAEFHNHLGNALQDAGDQDEALVSYRRAIDVDDTCISAHQNLGFVLVNHGYLEEGMPHLRRAQELQPADINRVLMATSLPVIYESVEHVQRERSRIEREVEQLVDDGVTIDTTETTVPTNFFCAYQGKNDREIQAKLGQIHQGVDLCPSSRRRTGRIKIGFLSDHFCNHTIGRLNLGTVKHFPRDQFEVTVISVGQHDDDLAKEFQMHADRYVVVPNQVKMARQMIAELGLDILFFADVGMHHVIYTLSFSRMAPIQCATWGHPVTTGSPTIDYFISSDHLEVDESSEHYTEKLIRLPRVNVCYELPDASPDANRSAFGLAEEDHIYLCPQTLFKFHPEFDEILASILRSDSLGKIVLIEGRVPQWTRLLRERFDRTMPDVASRIVFLPGMPHEDFLALNRVANVALDPIHFGGGNTSYEAFAVGLPVVTWPSQLMRGRITYALYQQMEMCDECVAQSPEDYVRTALKLGNERTYRDSLREKIVQAHSRIFGDIQIIQELARHLEIR